MKIVFASNKGGVGKTTTAVQLAIYQMSKGKRVCIVKADKNDDLFDLQEAREQLGKKLSIIEGFGDLTTTIEKANKGFDVVIVDCAGHDSAEFRTALQVCDVYLCLVKPSSDFETGTLVKITETVRKAEKLNPALRSFVVMTRVKQSTIGKAIDLEKVLTSDPVWLQPAKTRLSELTVFENACNAGLGVHELARGSSLAKAKAQIELLSAEIGL
ncbi:TPA: AAA family ATPase [Yersinia enterocolitica]|nr:AAA family ATPase [Yersinia enterocolitica]